MKQKKICISYPEIKLAALQQFQKSSGNSIEELLEKQLEDIYKKTVPKDVQTFIDTQITLSESISSQQKTSVPDKKDDSFKSSQQSEKEESAQSGRQSTSNFGGSSPAEHSEK